ncbi:linear gramicidin synthetase LgrA [Streptomyces sp. NBRC 110611]|uniref:amino acid adenylation domain-containing protein n=1 Tax=Streptomyces sp. NBRC 110611 TaxID=1621259 RepID=UPI0008378049|nr:amino acid adenylation domain-containing protein [Streptomyces sp. NBRC 110611]GAU67106.1 linear gramicidin synthetase LgrA [Streptomyces sp. NBRC 110611]
MSSRYGRANEAATIHGAFARVARELPERTAVVSASGAMTYAELAAEARHIAHRLIALGVRPGTVVPVVARRSPGLTSAILGVLMAGGAYGILDMRWPAPRIAQFLRAMRPQVVLADTAGSARLEQAAVDHLTFTGLRDRAAARGTPDGPLPEVAPEACATVFWTSGSTGTPKAVLSPHQATTRLFTPQPFMDFGEAPVMIHAAAVAWDAFSLELWGMLLTGGTAVCHPEDLLLPPAIRAYISDFGATHLFLTPSLFDVIAGGDIDCLAGLRAVLLGGDKPSPASCRRLFDAYPGIELYNGYGPVESCVFASTHRITEADTRAPDGIPAGLPVPGTDLHIVRDGAVVPRGEPGEIAIGGTGLALGYLDAPGPTAAAFRDIEAGGERRRVYLTGDQGRLDESGSLRFAGRKDAQIKVAGHRIEPAEIESAVHALGSKRSVVIPIPDRSGAPRIILFAESPGTALSEQDMQGRLRETLPAYMVPSKVHFVSAMPLLENTKIDKRELSALFGYHS